MAVVTHILTPEQAKLVFIDARTVCENHTDLEWKRMSLNLLDIHSNEIKNCDWIFAPETDYFIEASCPVYDDNNLWFARTKDGGWFSMNIQSWWQSGELDVDESKFNEIIEFWKNDKYTSEESRKAIVESYLERKYEK
jgi:hypothetical protein